MTTTGKNAQLQLGPDVELRKLTRKAWGDLDLSRPPSGPSRMGAVETIAFAIQDITGASFWRKVVADIAAENAPRRQGPDDDPYWTWDQWDRFMAAIEQTRIGTTTGNSFVHTFATLRRRITTAKADGLSAWHFHLALKRISEHEDEIAAKQRARTAEAEKRAEQSAYNLLLQEALRKERARVEARRIVQEESGGSVSRSRRRPPPGGE